MSDSGPSIFRRLHERVFPKTPDFLTMLAEQCQQVGHTTSLLVEYMETGDSKVGDIVKRNEHEADVIKVRNIHALNEAFSTPIDREDIYRAIIDLDDVVDYCKSTVFEMETLGIKPDKYDLEMAVRLREGTMALSNGYARLKATPAAAAEDANAARKAERMVERIYRNALVDLFQGDDYIAMFKHREIYRHLSNAADRMAHCANTLHHLVVKLCRPPRVRGATHHPEEGGASSELRFQIERPGENLEPTFHRFAQKGRVHPRKPEDQLAVGDVQGGSPQNSRRASRKGLRQMQRQTEHVRGIQAACVEQIERRFRQE